MKQVGCVEYRIDVPPYNGIDPMSLAPANMPGPGVYRNIPDIDYHAWDACSASRLKDLAQSPEHCRWFRDHPKEPTPTMRLGTALHAALLEPKRFREQYPEPQPCGATVHTTGKLCEAKSAVPRYLDGELVWRCGRHQTGTEPADDIQVLTATDRETLDHMTAHVAAHATASKLLDLAGEREMSVVFELEGVQLRSRIDLYAAGKFLADVKTTREPIGEAFGRQVLNLDYLVQLACYREALRAHDMPVEHVTVLAVGNVPPYAVRVYQINEARLEVGRVRLLHLLADYAAREQSGDWTGDGGTVSDLELPAWAERRLADQN